MVRSGLVSITFRKLAPRQIVDLAARAGLEGIEWGGDVHVPHGDLARAREVRGMTADAGLAVPSFGSYYRVGHAERLAFGTVLATAVELGAPVVRVWAGKKGSAEAEETYRRAVVEDSCRIADEAAAAGVAVAYELHGHTLTDTNASALELLQAVGRDNLQTYWQPLRGMSAEQRLAGLEAVLPWLRHLHVFHWDPDTGQRMPLAAGRQEWLPWLRRAASTGREHFAMIEFVRDDDPQAFLADASALKDCLAML